MGHKQKAMKKAVSFCVYFKWMKNTSKAFHGS